MNEMFLPEKRQYSVVLIGEFNPMIFQPEWFRRNDILSPEEVDVAQNQNAKTPTVISPQLTMFKTSQLSLHIEQKRFQVVAEKEPLIILKDFVSKTFEKLGGVVITSFGFNYSAHYKIESQEKYQIIGDRLAPKQYWECLLEDEVSGVDRKSGLISLTMQKTKDEKQGHLSMNLQPSALVQPGLYISCNDHTNMSEEQAVAEYAIERIVDIFDQSFDKMVTLQETLLAEVTKEDE